MLYFAYGSNLNKKQMKKRCKNAKFLKRTYLVNYEFVYVGYSSSSSYAVATITAKKDSTVWGALYEIDEDCLKNLDIYEGYPTFYNRKIVKVYDDSGNNYDAWVYIKDITEKKRPSENYKKIVLEGARDCELPEEYIRKYIVQSDF
ncbi:MAG: gamma-glutamylcyclotransferase [bacterium]|nr:gamma-glutamylcyclotransferase [bacterium]